ncbi:MAG TPA: GatB/YqeY domain-containing protein [Caldilineae bacterium]|nr:GatB/YqeY domain-containing protein [Caldilineae bacterium]
MTTKLIDRLNEDLKEAMRAGDEARKLAIRAVKTAIRNAEVEKMAPLDEGEILAVIAKEAKMRRDAIEEFKRGGRPDLVAKEEAELAVLESYLPRQLTEEEIEARAREVIEELKAAGQANMGNAMRRLMGELRGRADGRLVNQIVRRLLEQG